MSSPHRFYVLVLIVHNPNIQSLVASLSIAKVLSRNCRRSLDEDAIADNALWRERHIQSQQLHDFLSSAILSTLSVKSFQTRMILSLSYRTRFFSFLIMWISNGVLYRGRFHTAGAQAKSRAKQKLIAPIIRQRECA